jgi:hypothetical protein
VALGAAMAVALFVTAACVTPDDPLPVVVWEASIGPLPEAELTVTGQAAMVAQEFDTVLGIGITLLEDPRTLNWRVREGRCETPGDPVVEVAAFPPLVPDEGGEASAQFAAAGRAPSTPDYMVEVVLVSGGEESRLACSALVRQ